MALPEWDKPDDKRKKTPANDFLLRQTFGPLDSTEKLIDMGLWHGQIVHESALNRLPFIPRIASKILTNIFDARLIEKGSRQQVTSFRSSQIGARQRTPEYLYPIFMTLYKTHWLLRTIARAIIGEVMAPGWDVEPRFRKKCDQCGAEYDNAETDKCDICEGKAFSTPDIDQYKKLKTIVGLDPLNRSNTFGESRTFKNFLYSTLAYGVSLDDWYWEMGETREYKPGTKDLVSTPQTARVLDGAITFPVMDEYGDFTSQEYFCPICYKETMRSTKVDEYVDLRSSQEKNPENLTCSSCGGKLKQTAYIQKNEGKIVARYTKDQIVHVSTSRIDPEIFGLSKIIAAVKLLYIIEYMDEFNLQTYQHGHLTQLIGIEGADDNKIDQITKHVQNSLRGKTQADVATGASELNLEPALVFLGTPPGKAFTSIDVSPKLDVMQSIDYYRLYVEKIAGLFGVTPVFVNMSEPGSSSMEARPRIEVQNRITRQWMTDIEEPFNNILIPRFGITDWVLKFGKIESRDELRDQEIRQRIAATVAVYEARGHDVEVSEDGTDFTVSPKPVRPAEGAMSRMESMRTSQTDADPANAERTQGTGKEPAVSVLEPEDSGK